MPLRPGFSCRAYIERHVETASVLITKLTCTGSSAMGPKNLVLVLRSMLIQSGLMKRVYFTCADSLYLVS